VGGVQCVSDDAFGITNTLAFPDPHHLITADTLANTLYRFPLERPSWGEPYLVRQTSPVLKV
jgi:sugar lactone lactonase YvrE